MGAHVSRGGEASVASSRYACVFERYACVFERYACVFERYAVAEPAGLSNQFVG
jgi:hypothetical protein